MDLDGRRPHLERQDGVISRRQVPAAGGDEPFIRRMVRRREWARAHRGVYVDHTGPVPESQRAWAAALALWPAALCHVSALASGRFRRDVRARAGLPPSGGAGSRSPRRACSTATSSTPPSGWSSSWTGGSGTSSRGIAGETWSVTSSPPPAVVRPCACPGGRSRSVPVDARQRSQAAHRQVKGSAQPGGRSSRRPDPATTWRHR